MVQPPGTWHTAGDSGRRPTTGEPRDLSDLTALLAATGVVPLIEADSPESGVAIAQALHAAGMPLAEVVQRTAASRDCLRAISLADTKC